MSQPKNGTSRRGRERVILPTPPEFLGMPGHVIRRLYQAYTAAWAKYIDPVLTGPQYAVLSAIKIYPGEEQGSLARAVALDPSTMTGIIQRLEERGLLTRVQPLEDRRKRLLNLTDEGLAVLTEADQRARKLDGLLMDGLDFLGQKALLDRLNERTERWEQLLEG